MPARVGPDAGVPRGRAHERAGLGGCAPPRRTPAPSPGPCARAAPRRRSTRRRRAARRRAPPPRRSSGPRPPASTRNGTRSARPFTSDQSNGTPVPPGSCVSPAIRVSTSSPRRTRRSARLVRGEALAHADGLDRPARQAREGLGRLVAVQLQQVEADACPRCAPSRPAACRRRRRPAARTAAARARSPRPAPGRPCAGSSARRRSRARRRRRRRPAGRPRPGDPADLDEQPLHAASASCDQLPQGRARVGRAHQALADEEGVEARLAQARDVLAGADAALGDGDDPVGDLARPARATVSSVTASVFRSRLLTPTIRAPAASAVELGLVVHLDQRVEAGLAPPSPSRPRSAASSSAATISSTASAPAARASQTCQGSTTKSLRSTGRPALAAPRRGASSRPPKNGSS